ncbi:alanine racemase [Sphingomonas arenae]|uniref:alanine racemase n=1 Tax=Sphingomonas arenae TaxID=2812555 RepID=UPI0019671B99|nr:alanine racemase [Sphingomonas arenae]
MHQPLRMICNKDALATNWKWLAARAGVRCAAAVKADGYGLGAREVVSVLVAAGCRDFFVSTWWEAEQLGLLPVEASLAVLHGIGPDDLRSGDVPGCRPVLNTPDQVARWKQIAPERPCDVMIDTGMNRLGLRPEEGGVLAGLRIHTLHSHLACADEDHLLNGKQLRQFRAAAAAIPAERYSLANSAGILLGPDYAFDLVRPGLSLYGGIPRLEARGHIEAVVQLEAQVVQRRTIPAGESCGYGATFVAAQETQVAIANIGYADGYWRGFSSVGSARFDDAALPVLGRVSMDLVALDCGARPGLKEGDWISLDFELERAAEQSGKSQYELLTGLGHRFERHWH